MEDTSGRQSIKMRRSDSMVLRPNWYIYNVTLYLRLREQHGRGVGRVLKAKDQETFCETVSSRLDKVPAPMKSRQ